VSINAQAAQDHDERQLGIGASFVPAKARRILTIAPVVLVLFFVAVQAAQLSSTQHAGAARRSEALERLIAEARWAEATEACRASIDAHPVERRSHLQMSQCLLAKGLPGMSLEHLVMAATPHAQGAARPLLAAPTQSEIDRAWGALEKACPTDMTRPLSRLRAARLALMANRQTLFLEELRFVLAAPCDAPVYGPQAAARSLLSLVFAAGADAVPRMDVANRACNGLLAIAGARQFHVEMPGAHQVSSSLAVAAGGTFAGDAYIVHVSATERRFAAKDWLFTGIDPETGQIVMQTRLELAPLTNERAALRAWAVSPLEPIIVIGMASGEAVHHLSQEGRAALRECFDLRYVPGSRSLAAYVFVTYQLETSIRAVETRAAAADLPAMMFVEAGAK